MSFALPGNTRRGPAFAFRFVAPLAAALILAGCATPPPLDDPEARAEWEETNDPLEPMNRAIFQFNYVVDGVLIKPVATGYRELVPREARTGIRNFLHNLRSPVIFANQIMQADGEGAGTTFSRFMVNSTLGVLGLFDVATRLGLERQNADFGQTLAVWGMDEGPYLVLPLLGPSNPRDTAGLVVDIVMDPLNWWARDSDQMWTAYTRAALTAVDRRERLLDVLDEIERTALDFYRAVRTMHRQSRAAAIRGVNTDPMQVPPGMTGGLDFEYDLRLDLDEEAGAVVEGNSGELSRY